MTTLFLKYRPQNFADLVGQEHIVKTLKNALKNKRPAHAYLFVGSRGTGKTSTARILAKGLNSHDENTGEIIENDLTSQIAAGDCVDIIEIDAASHTGVDNIRDLIEKVQFLPTYAKRKVYIIDEVHMLSKGAFNALLKTLEEPPEHAYFLLATTELHKVPDTIVSRCQTFIFGRFTIDQLVARLEEIAKTENISVEKEALEMLAKQAEGGLRDAISLLEQMAAETDNQVTAEATRKSLGISPTETLESFWNGIQAKDATQCLAILKQLNQDGGDFRTFGHDLLGFLREQMHANLGKSNLDSILKTIEAVQKAMSQLKTTPIVELPLEIAVIELCDTREAVRPLTPQPTPAPAQPKPEVIKPEPQPAPTPVVKPEPQPEVKKTPSTESLSVQNNRSDLSAKPEPSQSLHPDAGRDLSMQEIQAKMIEIADKSGIPVFVKKSFLTSSPQVLEGTINFAVSSSFHLEQLEKAEYKHKISEAITDIFGQKHTIEFSRGHKSASNQPVDMKSKSAGDTATADDFLTF